MTKQLRNYSILGAIAACLSTVSAAAAVEIYKADPNHSSVNFKIRHVFSPVPGTFRIFDATIAYDRENPANNSVEATIEVSSVDTYNNKRDKHLLTEDFFNEPVFPDMTFVSTHWEPAGTDRFAVTGDLTIFSTTKEVVLDVHLMGSGPNQRGVFLTGWRATTLLDRTDFGIKHGRSTVGDEVSVEIFVEARRQ